MPLVPGVSRIAVLRANALGDYLFAVPALDALRAAYPSAEVVLLGAPWHAEVLGGRPGPVDRVLVVPALPGVRAPLPDDPMPATEAAAFFDKARQEEFDLAIQLHGGGRNSNPVVAALGARVTAGLRAGDAPPLDRTIPYLFYQHEVFRHLEVVALVGAAPVTYRPTFRLRRDDELEAGRVAPVGPGPRVVMHPGATDPRRRWPPERFAAVGDAVAAAGAEVVVTGTPSERGLVDWVCAAMRAPARPLVGALSVGGLAALLARSALVVSNDTGPLHLAAAVGTATVGIYWIGNLVNFAEVDRAMHRPLVSWRIHCPVCGLDCTRDLYPHRDGPPPCDHRMSFVVDIPAIEAIDEAVDLLARWRP